MPRTRRPMGHSALSIHIDPAVLSLEGFNGPKHGTASSSLPRPRCLTSHKGQQGSVASPRSNLSPPRCPSEPQRPPGQPGHPRYRCPSCYDGHQDGAARLEPSRRCRAAPRPSTAPGAARPFRRSGVIRHQFGEHFRRARRHATVGPMEALMTVRPPVIHSAPDARTLEPQRLPKQCGLS